MSMKNKTARVTHGLTLRRSPSQLIRIATGPCGQGAQPCEYTW